MSLHRSALTYQIKSQALFFCPRGHQGQEHSVTSHPSLVPVEPREEGMGLPDQLYSSTEDVSRCFSTVSQTVLDQALEGLGPFQQPLSQALQVLRL